MFRPLRIGLFALAGICMTGIAPAATMNIGYFSFNDADPFTNQFVIQNFTGNLLGNDADYLVDTVVVFQNLVVTLKQTTSSVAANHALPDLAPGQLQPNSLRFADAILFEYAVLNGTFDTLSWNTTTGMFSSSSNTFSATIVPTTSATLAPSIDAVIITAEGTLSMPEPGSAVLGGAGLLALGLRYVRRRV